MKGLEKKKILFLITKSNWGGAQRYVYDIATTLPRDRFEAVVALGGDGPLKTRLEEAGIRTIGIPTLQRDISLAKELGSFREIWHIVASEQPQVLHVNSSKAGGIGALVGRLKGIPKIVYSAHGWAFNEDRGLLGKFVVGFFHWLTVMFAHVTIAVSNAVKHQMRWPFAQRKIVVVHNGRPAPDFLERDKARAACIEHAPTIQKFADDIWTGTIAELHPIKRHDIAIDAIAKLVAEGKTVRHLIIGEGEVDTQLKTQVRERGLSEHIFFLGHVPDAASLLRAFDIFVLPSRSEALGYTVIEAAQAGAAIVATRVGGIPEIITDGWDGLLIPPNDADALHTALSKLISDPSVRQKLQHAAKVRGQHFSLEKMVTDTAAIYNI